MAEPLEPKTITTTIEVDRELFLRFKSLCVLNQVKISAEIEKLIRKKVNDMTQEAEQTESAKRSAQARVPWQLK